MPGSHVGCNCKCKRYRKCKDLHVNYPNANANASDNAKNENTFIFFNLQPRQLKTQRVNHKFNRSHATTASST